MSYTSLKDKEVKGRKEYTCSWCGEVIEKGEKHRSRTYIFYGDFNSSREHLECSKAMNEIDWRYDDGYIPHEYKRGSIDPKEY